MKQNIQIAWYQNAMINTDYLINAVKMCKESKSLYKDVIEGLQEQLRAVEDIENRQLYFDNSQKALNADLREFNKTVSEYQDAVKEAALKVQSKYNFDITLNMPDVTLNPIKEKFRGDLIKHKESIIEQIKNNKLYLLTMKQIEVELAEYVDEIM